MQDFRKRRSYRAELLRAALLTLGGLAVAGVAFFAMRGAWGMYQKFAAASAASAAAEARLADLTARHGEVETEVDSLNTSRGVEGELRQRYGVALPGEGEITVVHQGATSTQGAAEGSWWAKLWHSIFVW